jgi:hypothetical protein
MAVGVLEGLGGFTQIRDMTPWGRPVRQGLGHGRTEGGLAGSDAPAYGPLERLLHLA